MAAVASFPKPIRNQNLVLLPDGTVLSVGGNASRTVDQPNFDSFLYNPKTNTWQRLAAQQRRRAYHSTAVLLPDGRVLSAGDNNAGGGGTTVEVFSPPYLFKGARPAITSSPQSISYRSSFAVSATGNPSRAILMAPAATTHANDMHQRHVELAVTGGAGGLNVNAPPSASVAPPGWYMLFVMTADGVPSVARWIHLG